MFKYLRITMIITTLILLICCEDKVVNPGDFNLKSQLEIVQVYDSLGTIYPVNILRSFDTTFVYPKVTRDTLKDVSGKPLLDAQNKMTITLDTAYVTGNKTGRYIILDTIVLNYAKSALRIELTSNARWQAPTPNFGTKIAWFQTLTSNGGGDAIIKSKVSVGLASKRRPVLANQYIYSRDSLVIYKLTFDQKSKIEL